MTSNQRARRHGAWLGFIVTLFLFVAWAFALSYVA